MDCFYAAVEVRDRPELRGRPVAVGGSAQGRGVLTTCSYEARRHGVRSAMPSARALRLCPDLIILPVDMARYRRVSREIQTILRELTPQVEPMSLDEAYLDVSDCPDYDGSATLMARELRRRIREGQGLTASTGVAPNKFLAKVASDWNKPDGELVIRPEQVADFVRALPLAKVPGVGPVTAARLKTLGIETCGDVQRWTPEGLTRHLGRFGQRLHELAHGIDSREVKTVHRRKSLSVERTYQQDLADPSELDDCLPALYAELERRIERAGGLDCEPVKAVVLKLKFRDFSITTAQRPATAPDLEAYRALAREAWGRRALPVRLIGLGIRLREPTGTAPGGQLELWSPGLGPESGPAIEV
jgi:DNA polymerase-4